MVAVILACGGSSTRMGGKNKLFMPLGDITVIERTILAFDNIDEVREIILCGGEDFRENFVKSVHLDFKKQIKFAKGGKTRQTSVFNGFETVSEDCSLVCIHDGARPLVNADTIRSAFADAVKYGSAVVCVPVKDTVKLADADGRIAETPPRNRLFLTQTPQVFPVDVYKEAVLFANKCGFDFTDDSQLLEAMGIMPHITLGEYSNLKITTPEDIIIAEHFLAKKS